MITISEWFENNRRFRDAYNAYVSMPDNCTIMTFTLIQPIADMCGLGNQKSKVINFIKHKLIEADTSKELGLTEDECKEQSPHNKNVRKKFIAIKCKYRQKIPAQLYFLAKGTDWLNEYVTGVYKKITENMGKPCIVEKFKTYKEIDEYCYVIGVVHGSTEEGQSRGKIAKKREELKAEGIQRNHIISELVKILKMG